MLLGLKTRLTNKVNHLHKGRFLGGGVHNSVEVKESLDLFTLGEDKNSRVRAVEDIIWQCNKGQHAVEFGRYFGEPEAEYNKEKENGPGFVDSSAEDLLGVQIN